MTYSQLLRTALAQGQPIGKALEQLRASGASPAEAAQAVQLAAGVDKARAREIVADSRAWKTPRVHATSQSGNRDATGQHGRSGHGASSVLPHLVKSQSQTATG